MGLIGAHSQTPNKMPLERLNPVHSFGFPARFPPSPFPTPTPR